MIKVLHYGLSENRGGIETYLNKLWSNIDKSQFHFDFLDTNLGKPCFYDEFREMGSEFYKITPRRISIYKNKKDLKDLFTNERFSIVHFHLNTLSYILPIKIALKQGCKVIVHSRSSNSPNSIITKVLHYLNFFVLNAFYKDRIIKVAVSKVAGEWMFGKKNTFTVINNGVDIERFKYDHTKRVQKRDELDIENKFVIGHVGALNFPKNHDYLFRVFKSYLVYHKDTVLVLVGDGKLKLHLSDLASKLEIADKVKFLGSRKDTPELLFAMDILLFPSRYEGFPNVLLEAQTTGLPCIISNKITKEIVVSRECKILSISESPNKWADEIHKNYFNIDRETAYKNVETKGYSIKKEIAKIEKLYFKIL